MLTCITIVKYPTFFALSSPSIVLILCLQNLATRFPALKSLVDGCEDNKSQWERLAMEHDESVVKNGKINLYRVSTSFIRLQHVLLFIIITSYNAPYGVSGRVA